MNTQQIVVKCNSCQAVIPTAGQQGATRLAGTEQFGGIDFCVTCSEMSVSQAAKTFTLPQRPKPQKVKLANGTTTILPPGAPLPAGSTVVAQ